MVVVDGTADDDNDGDFVANDDDEDDDDFIVDDDEDRKPTKKKGKGKRKASTKIVSSAALDLDFPSYLTDGVNPKVMLISLKAGALGLNLTVANNVYLYVLMLLALLDVN